VSGLPAAAPHPNPHPLRAEKRDGEREPRRVFGRGVHSLTRGRDVEAAAPRGPPLPVRLHEPSGSDPRGTWERAGVRGGRGYKPGWDDPCPCPSGQGLQLAEKHGQTAPAADPRCPAAARDQDVVSARVGVVDERSYRTAQVLTGSSTPKPIAIARRSPTHRANHSPIRESRGPRMSEWSSDQPRRPCPSNSLACATL
jgi:hypothetical protein